jgi:hypothetical protein
VGVRNPKGEMKVLLRTHAAVPFIDPAPELISTELGVFTGPDGTGSILGT